VNRRGGLHTRPRYIRRSWRQLPVRGDAFFFGHTLRVPEIRHSPSRALAGKWGRGVAAIIGVVGDSLMRAGQKPAAPASTRPTARDVAVTQLRSCSHAGEPLQCEAISSKDRIPRSRPQTLGIYATSRADPAGSRVCELRSHLHTLWARSPTGAESPPRWPVQRILLPRSCNRTSDWAFASAHRARRRERACAWSALSAGPVWALE